MVTYTAASCFGLPVFTQSTTRNTDDIVVQGGGDEVILGTVADSDSSLIGRGASGVSGRDGISGGLRND